MSAHDTASAAKRRLRADGWFIRYTEWPSGHQVVLHRREDTSVHLVTRWCPTEEAAFEEALELAEEHARARGRGRTAARGSGRDLDVVVLGDAREDLVVRARQLPAPGAPVEGEALAREAAGRGLRQAIAASRLGARVALVARVGADADGDEVLARARAEGVQVQHVARDPSTPTAVGLVHEDSRGARIRATAASGHARVTAADVGAGEGAIRGAAVLLASADAVRACGPEASRVVRGSGTTFVLDATTVTRVPAWVLAMADFAIVDARSARAITGRMVRGRQSALRAARSVLRHVDRGAVALMMARAVLLLGAGDAIWIARPVPERAGIPLATGAFCAAFATAIAEGSDLGSAGRLGVASAALAERGRRERRLPSRSEVDALASELVRGEEPILDGASSRGAAGPLGGPEDPTAPIMGHGPNQPHPPA